MPVWKMLPAAAGFLLMTLASAEAAPMTGTSGAIEAQGTSASEITQVYYRRGFHGHRHGGYGTVVPPISKNLWTSASMRSSEASSAWSSCTSSRCTCGLSAT